MSNRRNDAYGGDLKGRMRLPLDIVKIVREEWPHDKPVFFRLLAADESDPSWTPWLRNQNTAASTLSIAPPAVSGQQGPQFAADAFQATNWGSPSKCSVALMLDRGRQIDNQSRAGRRDLTHWTMRSGGHRPRGALQPELAGACRD